MPVIADSSGLIGLFRIGRLVLLRRLYGRVLIPGAVRREVIDDGKRLRRAGAEEIEKAVDEGWIQVRPLGRRLQARAASYLRSGGIGQGETEAIVLAASQKTPVILDDLYARHLATSLDVEFLGTGAVLLEARLRDLLDEEEYEESLGELGRVMWLSPDVLAELLKRGKKVRG